MPGNETSGTDVHSGDRLLETEGHDSSSVKFTKNQLMEKYEYFTKELREQTSEANKGAASKIVLQHLDELHSLYGSLQRDKVRDTKMHLKDAEAFKEIASFAANNAKNLKIGTSDTTLSSAEMTTMLKKYMGVDANTVEEEIEESPEIRGIARTEETFNAHNWLKLGSLYYQTSQKAVSSEFLYGPLATERRRQATRTVTVDDTKNVSLSTAQQVQASEVTGNEEHNTAYMVRLVYGMITRNLGQGEGINFFRLFMNPYSFPQSVENLFFISFLIKDARLKIYLEDGVPHVRIPTSEEEEIAKMPPSTAQTTHHISTLDYGTWKAIIDTYNISEPFLGHRDELEDQAPNDL